MKSKAIKYILLLVLFLSVSFNISYWAIAKYDVTTDFGAVSDAQYYIKMVQSDFDNIPYRYFNRFLMPATVSLVYNFFQGIEGSFLSEHYEISEKKIIQLSFGFVNIIFITLTAFLFYFYCKDLDFSEEESLIAVFLFYTSFFVVTYYTLPLVDSMACFFVMACFYVIKKEKLFWLCILFILGLFAKEAVLVVLLIAFLNDRTLLSKKLLACLPGVIFYSVVTSQSDSSTGDSVINIMLSPSLLVSSFKLGLKSINFYTLIEMVQTFMFIWVLFIIGLFKKDKPVFLKKQLWLLLLPFVAPFLVGLSVVGRVSFYLFPLVIPVAMIALRDLLSSPNQKDNLV